MKKIIINLLVVMMSSTIITGNMICERNVQASTKSNKAIKNAKKHTIQHGKT